MITKDLVKSLNRFGITAAAYHRPPMGRSIFAISIQPRTPKGTVTVNQGNAKVEVFGSRTRKQAVVIVREAGRKVSKRVKAVYTDRFRPDQLVCERQLRSNFNVIMPSESVWSFANLKVVREKAGLRATGVPRPWIITGKVTARVKKTTRNNLLIGMDETHHFIAPLPKKAKSVTEAHRMLRPQVKRGSKRSGEWFFEPCDHETREMVNKVAAERLPQSIGTRRNSRGYRLGQTTHYAAVLVRAGKKKQLYARGDIIDGRVGHHALMFLSDWHRVVRNREGTIKVHKDQRERLQRSRATWD